MLEWALVKVLNEHYCLVINFDMRNGVLKLFTETVSLIYYTFDVIVVDLRMMCLVSLIQDSGTTVCPFMVGWAIHPLPSFLIYLRYLFEILFGCEFKIVCCWRLVLLVVDGWKDVFGLLWCCYLSYRRIYVVIWVIQVTFLYVGK